MRVLLRGLLAVLLARLGLTQEDSLSLFQQSLSLAQGLASLAAPGGGQVAPFVVGEVVQVKLKGESAWTDCTIKSQGSGPDLYNVHVYRNVDGAMTEKTHHDVPASTLRRVFRGYEVSIEQGDDTSSWVACNILSMTNGRYTVELTEMRPGMVIENVRPSLLRDGSERSSKAKNFADMVKENEAKKGNFYSAKMKPVFEEHKQQLAAEKKRVAEERDAKEQMQQYVWQEMAKKAQADEATRQEKLERNEKRDHVREVRAAARKKAHEEQVWAQREERALEDPIAAMMVQARELAKESAAKEKELRSKRRDQEDEVQKTKDLRKKIAEDQTRAIEEKMARMKKEHEAFLKAKQNSSGTAAAQQNVLAQRATKVLSSMDQEQKEKQKMFEEVFAKQTKLEEERYTEEEEHRKESVKLRKLGVAHNKLRTARRALETEDDDIDKRDHWGLLHALASATHEAANAGVEAEEVDNSRALAVKEMTLVARKELNSTMDSESLEELERALKRLPIIAQEIDEVWQDIKDPEAKWQTSHFEESELEGLKKRVPELQHRELRYTALRSGLRLARMEPHLLEKAIHAAEKGGLPLKEVDEAQMLLKSLQAKPDLSKEITKARRAGDVGRMAKAIADAEEAGFSANFLHNARHQLHVLATRKEMNGENVTEEPAAEDADADAAAEEVEEAETTPAPAAKNKKRDLSDFAP